MSDTSHVTACDPCERLCLDGSFHPAPNAAGCDTNLCCHCQFGGEKDPDEYCDLCSGAVELCAKCEEEPSIGDYWNSGDPSTGFMPQLQPICAKCKEELSHGK